ncbi:serine/threonine-protein phosphatase 6 regulatory ankyrin repeat subunit C-like isoform X5 [Triticum urartu]|uniref:serine/threonine-protein phosphatase 6 regulatory ankyrin repeat subunit C-like isoform X5 n=1 Tax=Triticum urartu TaxID=4572 RepID=UPI0020445E29|nr:serine/threonine-protein phosphatase 6 regulatory ankyrin repeat subunit C-like isoform X5 [Triticum urartu]
MEVFIRQVLNTGADNLMDPVFREAADKGNIISLQELAVKPNIIYSTTKAEKNTGLHIAASKGHTLFVHHFLLHAGMNMELMVSQNNDGDTPLHLAARAGHLEVVEHLIQYSGWARKINANLKEPTIMVNTEGNTPLHDALFKRHLDITIKLLEVNPRCAEALNTEITNQLSTGSVSTIGTCMIALLHQTALHDNIWALEILLNNIVGLVKLTDSSGNNALHYATLNNRVRMVSMLLNKNSALACKKNTEEHTPLHIVAKYGFTEAAKELLKQCPDAIKVVDLDGRNALHIAIVNNKLSILELLLKYKLPKEILNKQDNDGNTLLHHAARLHQGPSILWLLNDPRINSFVINKEGHTAWAYQIPIEPMAQALSNAIDKGDMLSLVNFLADCPEGVYSVTPIRGDTAVHLAASKGNDCVVHHVLLYTNRNVGFIISKNINGDTPLHLAVRAGHVKVVDHLMHYMAWAKEIEPNLKLKGPIIMANKLGNTPLHNAVLQRKSDIALKLLEANPGCAHMSNAARQSPFYIAVRDGLTYVVKKIADQKMAVEFMSTQANPLHESVLGDNILLIVLIRPMYNIDGTIKRALEIVLNRYEELVELSDLLGNNALHYAAEKNNARIVSILLNKNHALAYKQNNEKHTPLHIAAYYGSTEAAKELLKQFPDVIEMVDNMGRNALHIAAINDKVSVLELLLKYVLPKEIVNQQDRDGNTPLHHAGKLFGKQAALLLLNDRRVKPCLVNQDEDAAFSLSQRTGIERTYGKHKLLILTKQQPRPLQNRRTSPQMAHNIVCSVLVVVATLMGMSTFAVTLTVPGGYNQQSGAAIVGHHQAFNILVICNAISMCGSTVVALCIFLWKGHVETRVSYGVMLFGAKLLIVFSGLTMIMSMLTAIYLTITPMLVAYVGVAIGASVPLLVCLVVVLGKSVYEFGV